VEVLLPDPWVWWKYM